MTSCSDKKLTEEMLFSINGQREIFADGEGSKEECIAGAGKACIQRKTEML